MKFTTSLNLLLALAATAAPSPTWAHADNHNNNEQQQQQPQLSTFTRERRAKQQQRNLQADDSEKVRIIVDCHDGKEAECLREIREVIDAEGDENVHIVHMLEGTDHFALLIRADEAEKIMAMEDVLDIVEDPPRYPMVFNRESGQYEQRDPKKPKNLRKTRQLQTGGEYFPYGVDLVRAPEVWPRSKGQGVKVCVMDSGLNSHRDIDDSRVAGTDLTAENNFRSDGDGHGTHVAGTIGAAEGNGRDIVGVAPLVDLKIVRVFNDNGGFFSSDIRIAINACKSFGVDIINMSLGGDGSSNLERNAFNEARSEGILSIAAAGNSGDVRESYPASYASVLSVGAVDAASNSASFTTRNNNVGVSAPGVQVDSLAGTNQIVSLQGTSMACPHVAGVAALLMGVVPQASNDQVREALEQTAVDRGSPGKDNRFGYGIVDTVKAVDFLTNTQTSCGSDEAEVVISVKGDQYSKDENSFSLTSDSDQDIISRTKLPNFGDMTYRRCIAKGQCYTFTMSDTYGDGVCCGYGNGSVDVTVDGASVASGAAFGSEFTENFCVQGSGGGGNEPAPTSNPTSSPTSSPTSEPTASPTSAPTLAPTEGSGNGGGGGGGDCPSGEGLLEFDLTTDDYGAETGYILFDRSNSNNVVASGPDTPFQDNTSYSLSGCFPVNTSYRFRVTDSYGDGICCSYGNGSFEVRWDGVMVGSGGSFGSRKNINFSA